MTQAVLIENRAAVSRLARVFKHLMFRNVCPEGDWTQFDKYDINDYGRQLADERYLKHNGHQTMVVAAFE